MAKQLRLKQDSVRLKSIGTVKNNVGHFVTLLSTCWAASTVLLHVWQEGQALPKGDSLPLWGGTFQASRGQQTGKEMMTRFLREQPDEGDEGRFRTEHKKSVMRPPG